MIHVKKHQIKTDFIPKNIPLIITEIIIDELHSVKYPTISLTVSSPSEFSNIIETGNSNSILIIK